MSRILSAVQPTGCLHLGNYLGAVRHWVDLQKPENELLFCVVDLHALTMPYDPAKLQANVLDTVATYLACGIDPKQATVFVQSAVHGHCDLAWLLGCITPLGWLNRMTQFKDKSGKHKDKAGLGLYSYPVLMAADILLYHTTHVPVGEDQKQHIELARDIAGMFNRTTKTDYFTLPEPVITTQAARVMSLRDGRNKMSKSDPSEFSRIHLYDDAATIEKKIKKAKSDSEPTVTYDRETRPEIANFIDIYATLTNRSIKQTTEECQSYNTVTLKQHLTQSLIDVLAPIGERYDEYRSDESYLRKVLSQGAEKANDRASDTMKEVRKLMGVLF